ncbi:MAG TPA: ABC transporter ATP-binding protein [Candidatus Eisenbacteria bacterium]|jgi:putative ABC transport system ATP-binding protein|nr:ABC transporter ATP-binding protein [Candidatus Eisenbacteria bacterium]
MMITLRGVTKTFETPAGSFAALRGIDLDIKSGEFVAVVGKSGSGKSTLLNMIAGLDKPSTGIVSVAGAALGDLGHDGLATWRGRNVGVVFQFFQLLPTLTALENVMLPMDFSGAIPASRREARAQELLQRVGVADQAAKLPATLSGGQQQRVAIARALANDPPLLVADEPTGNLDSQTSAEIFALFAELVADGKTLVVVTHERETVSGAGRTLTLADGCVA